MRWSRTVFVLFLLICAQSSFAQGLSPKSLELSLSAGLSAYTNKTFQINYPQALPSVLGKMQISTNRRYDGRINFFSSKKFGAEAFYSFEKNNVVLTRTNPQPTGQLIIPQQIHHFGANALYYPFVTPKSVTRPYVYVGGGSMIYRPSALGQKIAKDPLSGGFSTFIESSRASADFGVGVKRSLGKTFGLRADIGDIITVAPTYGLPRVSTLVTGLNDSVLPVYGFNQNFQATIGFILFLGK